MSDSNDNSNASGGISLAGAVFLIFLALKLTGTGVVATWPWWIVTAPLWGGLVVVVGFLIGFAVMAAVVAAVRTIGEWVRRRRKLKRLIDDY